MRATCTPHTSQPAATGAAQVQFNLLVELVMSSVLAFNLKLQMPITVLKARPGGLPALPPAVVASPVTAPASGTAGAAPAQKLKKGRRAGNQYFYKDGSVYTGQWSNNMPNGRGMLRYANGDVYEGMFANHKAHGRGKRTYINGDVREGMWANGASTGVGTKVYAANGEVYSGDWLAVSGLVSLTRTASANRHTAVLKRSRLR